MADIKITLAETRKPLPDPDTLVFGKTFTDHMFLMNYDAGQGWHDPRIVPYGPLVPGAFLLGVPLRPGCCSRG